MFTKHSMVRDNYHSGEPGGPHRQFLNEPEQRPNVLCLVSDHLDGSPSRALLPNLG